MTFKLGLTGGIGSGKSTVAAMLADLGAQVLDADAISHKVTAPGGDAIDAIRHEFGAHFIKQDGSLDRAQMRSLIYADVCARERLQAIIHPLVNDEISRLEAQAINEKCPCLVFDIPLLVESKHWRARVDHILVVDCSIQTQIQRVVGRSGLTVPEVQAIISHQASRNERLACADDVIANDDTDLDALRAKVYQLAPRFGLSSPPTK